MANKSEMKLLLIDDQKSIRDIAKFMLQQAGFQHVDECDNVACPHEVLQRL